MPIGKQGLGIDGVSDVMHNPTDEITEHNFIQLDLRGIMREYPIPRSVVLTVQGLDTTEGFIVYESQQAGMLGDYVIEKDPNDQGPINTIVVPVSPRTPFISITATPEDDGVVSDVLLSAVAVPQQGVHEAPMVIVVDESIDNLSSVVGNFDGQLAIFKGISPVKVRYWDQATSKWK